MEKLQLIAIKNPFRREDRDIFQIEYKGESLFDLKKKFFKDLDLIVSVNGKVIPEDQLPQTFPVKNDQILFVPSISGGDDGKDIFRALLMITVTVASLALAPTLAGVLGIAGTLGTPLVAAGLNIVGGLLINAFLPPSRAKLPQLKNDLDTTQTYTWFPQTLQQPGIVIPRYYGTNKAYGNVIASNIEVIDDKKYLNILICFGLGPISRLYDFKINDQPVENFSGVEIHSRYGNIDQEIIPNFNDTKVEYLQSIKIEKDKPFTYITQGTQFNELEVDVCFPRGLWFANNKGELEENKVDLKIEIRKYGENNWVSITQQCIKIKEKIEMGIWSAGCFIPETGGEGPNFYWLSLKEVKGDPSLHYDGEPYSNAPEQFKMFSPYWRWIENEDGYVLKEVDQYVDYITIKDKKTSQIVKTFKAKNLTPGRYEIRITKLSEEKDPVRYGDELYFNCVREVYYDDFQYPRHVLVGIKGLASEQLSGSLNFSCLIDGALIRYYDGNTWQVGFNNNPAWVVWDMLTQPVFDNELNIIRYDGIDPSRLDLNKFKEWADFCDELVPDGNGGWEKRVTFNGVFDNESSLWESIIRVCQVGRAIPVWNGIKLSLAIDKPSLPVQLFSVGNIGINSFREKFLPLEERAAEIEADFINSENDYNRDKISVINESMPGKVGKTNLNFWGLTKPSEVWRACMYRLKCNEHLLRTVELDVDIDSIACTLGDVIYIQHDIPQWGYGGRIVSATSNSITIDQEVEIEQGKQYATMIRLYNDSIIERMVTNSPGRTSTLTFSSPLDPLPHQYDIFVFGEVQKVAKPFRIIEISRTQELKATLTCIEYNESIYNVDYHQPVIPLVQYSALSRKIKGVSNINYFISLRWNGVNFVKNIEIFFDNPKILGFSTVELYQGPPWKFIGQTPSGYFQIPIAPEGEMQIAFVVCTQDGRKQDFNEAEKIIIDTRIEEKEVPPPSNLELNLKDKMLEARWDPPNYQFIDRYEVWKKEGDGDFSKVSEVKGNEISIPISNPNADSFRVGVRTISILNKKSEMIISEITNKGETISPDIKFFLEGNQLTLFWKTVNDPQILHYEVRNGIKGATWEESIKIGESTTGSFTTTLNINKPVFWIRPKLVNEEYLFIKYFLDLQILSPIKNINVSIIEPNIALSWPKVAGADRYRLIIDSGGIASEYYTTEAKFNFPIPKYDTLVRIQAWSNSGLFSSWTEEEIDVTGIYNFNELISLEIDFIGGKYLNMCFTGSDEVRRPSVAGGAVILPIININDCDLFNFARAFNNIYASSIQDISASWFREAWWKPKDGFFESPVYDLGDVYSGRLIVKIDKTVNYLGSSIPDWEFVIADYIKEFTIIELEEQRTHLDADIYVSIDGITWKAVKNNDWIETRYVKIVAQVFYASPLSEIKVKTGVITIDVPDITESNIETVTGGNKYINFSKNFRRVNCVICNAVGSGVTAWATNVSKVGFTLNVSTGDQTQVFWFAKGY